MPRKIERVLVVEDDFDIRSCLKELLEQEGIEVDIAVNGSETLNCLRKVRRPPCIILLDLMMPVMNGWELLQMLQAEADQ